jgi:2-keto-4-pentenoate hydratase
VTPSSAPELDAVVDALLAADRDGGRTGIPAGLDLEAGYAIQRALVERRVAAGESAIGWKVGMASAIGRTPASPGPIYGRLLSGMLVEDGGTIERARLHGPYAEGEIAIVLARPLRGPGVTVADVRAAAAGARPAIEVFATRLDAEAPAVAEMVADNSSSAHFALGGRLTPLDDLDLRLCGLVFTRNDGIAGTGAGGAVGDPAEQVAWLANAAGARGDELQAGDVILTGALAGAHLADAGDVFTAEVDRLGSVSVRFA